jgi:hypothetical protein
MQFPPGVIEVPHPANLILADNVAPGVAIDAEDNIYYLYFAALRDSSSGKAVSGTTTLRVVLYAQGKPPEELKLALAHNATGKFMEFRDTLYVLGYYDEEGVRGKVVHTVAVPVPGAVCPCEVF